MVRRAARGQRGFTLIELMVVVVIIGIIASIATNMFSGSGQDAERARIVSEMSALNDAMARYYQGNFSYAPTGTQTNAQLLATLRTSAIGIQATSTYTVTLETATATAYRLVAKPLATGKMKGTGTYSVDEAGQRCHYTSDNQTTFTTCPQHW